MNKDILLQQLSDLFRDVLDNNTIVLDDKTTAKDVDEWDSLSHIQLVVAIEKKFKIKFSSAEIQNWQNVGQMAESIIKKLAI